MPSLGSLFSGIGGLDLGLERAGFTPLWQVENDPYCTRVLKKHWPGVPRYGDIRTIDTLPYVDLIAGGFPCQPTSHAGTRQGDQDDRWLWPEMLRLVARIRPHFVLGENVYGLVTANGGVLLSGIYTDLENESYEAVPPIVFPAAALGAPHRRDRVWICAHARHDGRCSEYGEQQAARAEESDRVRAVADADSERLEEQRGAIASRSPYQPEYRSWWSIEPDVDRVAYGIPHRVERLRGLGNAVVPQAAEFIGRQFAWQLNQST